jgi:hypothetical protein
MKKEIFILKNHNKKQKDIEIKATLAIKNKRIKGCFEITGDIENYLFDKAQKQSRKDELWKRTCFELFLANRDKPNYYELNMSPSSEWNFYHFVDYKKEMKEEKNISEPLVHLSKTPKGYLFSFEFDLYPKFLKDDFTFNLAVILLDTQGVRHFYSIHRKEKRVDFHDKTYWALKDFK